MTKAYFSCLLAVAVLYAPAPALAEKCSLDNAPAATLLLPYFEVDFDHAGGLTTLFSINNSSATAVLTNVVVWTDLGVPTLNFPVYLTGYDVQTFNLRDLFNGVLPHTATAGQDPRDTLSPKGPFSQDVNFASCTGLLPLPSALPPAFLASLRAAHTGKASAVLGGCAGRDLGDRVARGYVTVDTVNQCTLRTPNFPEGYFGLGGVATDQNVLWGDFMYVDPSNDYADGENLVRIEAFPGGFKPGDATFYGRYVNGSGIDDREPLATTWASRYVNGGAFSGGTDLIAWRDSGQVVRPFPCGTTPAGFPLVLFHEVTFDETENATSPQLFPCEPACPFNEPVGAFPAEAGRVHVGGSDLPTPFNFGWLFLNLKAPSPQGSVPRQAWVGTVMKAQGRFSVGFSATPLDSACAPWPVELDFVP
ncbi:MAG TPA: hypothetical protein VIA62_26055 [Thermoanaerobaculia bacterium]|jgi:hypothetical protein|nr:hypothetical protein [Thermoanaerobaculia bacterium]